MDAAIVIGLVPCALCGGGEGFKLGEGSTFRWYSLCCAACGQEVDEIRIAADPISAWNKAGAHAEGLRVANEHIAAGLVAAEDERDMLRDALAALVAAVGTCSTDLGTPTWHAMEYAQRALEQCGCPTNDAKKRREIDHDDIG